jgi:uncharacterized protein (TIGR03067 family)
VKSTKKQSKRDLDNLQGAWHIAALEVDGNKMPESMLGGSQVVVKGSKFDTVSMGAAYSGALTLDETANPKTFDLKFTDGPEKGNTNLGIYKLDGDIWTLCLATRGNIRPKTFATKPGTGIALETLKRGKAAKGTAGSSLENDSYQGTALAVPKNRRSSGVLTPASDDSNLPPATGIHGDWVIISGAQDGHEMEPFMIKTGKRVATASKVSVSFAGQVMVQAKYKTDNPKNPKTMDYVHTGGMHKGKTQAAICTLDGRTLKVCFAAPGQSDRPADFTTKVGDGRTLTVWKLVSQ